MGTSGGGPHVLALAARYPDRGNSIETEVVEERDVVVGDVRDAATGFSRRAAVAGTVSHQVARTRLSQRRLVGISLHARAGRALDPKQRLAAWIAPPTPRHISTIGQREHAVLERHAILCVLERLHFIAQNALMPSRPSRTRPSFRSILKIFDCFSHFEVPSTRKNSSSA